MRFYTPARRPEDEAERQRAVDASGLLDAAHDPALERIVEEAAAIFGAPMAALSIVDRDRQYFPAETGIGTDQTPRGIAFCSHAVLAPDEPFFVPDAQADDRFAGNPLVLGGPEIRFYLGMPVTGDDGQPIGTLCVLDRETGPAPSPDQLAAMADLVERTKRRAAELRQAKGE